MKTFIVAGLLGVGAAGAIGAALVMPAAPVRAMPVFDSSNYAQNLLIAARTLSQINNQIRSLQNEAEVLVNMAKNLSRIDFPQLSELQRKLRQIDLLMNQARLIDFRLDELDAKFRALFPEEYDRALGTDRRVIEARRRLDAGMEGFRHAMEVQAQVVGNIRDDAEALSAIIARSQDAEGSLQAQQATNQLLALAAKQQFQLQQMMASQFRSDAVEQARRMQESREARAATKRFIGDGKAWTPR